MSNEIAGIGTLVESQRICEESNVADGRPGARNHTFVKRRAGEHTASDEIDRVEVPHRFEGDALDLQVFRVILSQRGVRDIAQIDRHIDRGASRRR